MVPLELMLQFLEARGYNGVRAQVGRLRRMEILKNIVADQKFDYERGCVTTPIILMQDLAVLDVFSHTQDPFWKALKMFSTLINCLASKSRPFVNVF